MIGPGQGGMNAPGGAGSSANASTARLMAIISAWSAMKRTKVACAISDQVILTGSRRTPQRHGCPEGWRPDPFGSKIFISERTGCYGPLPVLARHGRTGGARRLTRLAT